MSLQFGTAGLRAPMQEGPDGMNDDVVARATAGLAAWLQQRCLGGGVVVVGYDARHHSRDFARITAEVFAAAGFAVRLFPQPLPTPITAFAVRELDAVAGVQITASHNPAADNGYKVFVSGGAQLIPPADREIEGCIAAIGPAAEVPRTAVEPDEQTGTDLLDRYLARVASLPHSRRGACAVSVSRRGACAAPVSTAERNVRIALTPMHGVGGATAIAALRAAGFTDVHVVAEQFAPDPDFPTVAFPNPEEPGATDLLLDLAERIDADLAIALDPDADRCAVGVLDGTTAGVRRRRRPTWRMLRGDETGVLLADYVLATAEPGSLVASTVVSSRLLGKLAPARGARHAETLTGFKWLVRAGDRLVYAYEEALGHCVDPDAVRDKDGISAAVLAADLAAQAKAHGTTLPALLDDLATEFGLHTTDQVSRRFGDLDAIAATMQRLRESAPTEVAGEAVRVTDLLDRRGAQRTDAVILEGKLSRIVVRPSGTEPKVKCYLEVIEPVASKAELPDAHARAVQRIGELQDWCDRLANS